tara:strand:- start:634 stop:855 length:222 start_codon:yes stop_codon:yes gene_type:complete
MGILDRIQGKETEKQQKPKFVSKSSNEELSLSAEETKILLHLIKNSNFKGDSVELVYNLTKKLQTVLGILTED